MPIKVDIYNQKGEVIDNLKLSDTIFSLKVNLDLVHQVVVSQMSNQRQVLAHTKDRSEVRGGGRKPWKQKGTGRARAGSRRSPIWVGGGITFGPRKDRNYKKKINKKMKQKALCMVLSDKLTNNSLLIIDKIAIKEFKTKKANEFLVKIENKVFKNKEENKKKQKRSILLVDNKNKTEFKYSIRNLQGVKAINLNNINIVDLLKYRNLILTKEAVNSIEEIYKNK